MCVCVCVCGRACLRLLSHGLLLNINKDFLPTRQSQTPDHLPRRTCPRIPQSWQPSATNKDRPVFFSCPSIKMFTCRTSIHKSCFLSVLHPERVRVYLCASLELDIMGGNYIQGDRARNNPPHTHTTSKITTFSPMAIKFGLFLNESSQDTPGEMCIFMMCITSYFSSLNIRF